MRGRPKGSSKGNLIRFLNDDQLAKFYEAIDSGKDKVKKIRDALLFRLILFYGLRAKEAQKIKLKDISFESRQITIAGVKGGRVRTYEIPDDLWARIDRWMKRRPKSNPYLFPHRFRENEPVGKDFIKLAFKKYARSAGLPVSFSVHSLRHTIAIRLAREGASPIRIMQWLRHRSIESSQVYFEAVQFMDDEKRITRILSDVL